MQRAVGNRAVTRLIQRQPTGTTSRPVGDAVRPEVTGYLTAFASASTNQERNRLTVQAFWAVARAYRLSTKGLTTVSFDPTLTKHDGLTTGLVDKNRESRVDLGPGAFSGGFESFVHIVDARARTRETEPTRRLSRHRRQLPHAVSRGGVSLLFRLGAAGGANRGHARAPPTPGAGRA